MATSNEQNITFYNKSGGPGNMIFSYSGAYKVTQGEDFGVVTWKNESPMTVLITARSGTSLSEPPANWFCKYVGNSASKMINNLENFIGAKPPVLDFAFEGVLIIDGVTLFDICLGYYQQDGRPAWFLCSDMLTANKNNKTGTLSSGSAVYAVQPFLSGFMLMKR